MKNVFFGLGLQYEDGSAPSIAMSRDGRVMEVHESIGDGDLAYRLGKRRQMGLLWAKQNVVYGRGLTPSIAFNGHLLMEVHKEIFGDDDLAWRTAVWNDGDEGPSEIRFSEPVKYASGKMPRIAMNDRIAVAVHQSPTGPSLWFNACDIGEDASVRWRGNVGLGPGIQPNIAINQGNVAVIVYRSPSDSNLYYRIGAVREIEVAWGQAIAFGTGSDAAVALSDDGEVIVVFQSSQSRTLLQRFGKIGDNAIHWAGDAVHFDNGQHACVACAGRMAIQAHESENTMTLWASTSRVTNRARWMHHNMDVLGDKTLPRLTTGASHDAGMYQHGALATLGKTQNLNIYQQLRNGIRYFDLRPKWSGNALYVHHGGISGPTVAEIADDVRNFMREETGNWWCSSFRTTRNSPARPTKHWSRCSRKSCATGCIGSRCRAGAWRTSRCGNSSPNPAWSWSCATAIIRSRSPRPASGSIGISTRPIRNSATCASTTSTRTR
ncbi:PI-PLC domain-containing protein [Lysobacter gummosus]|uniref:hypothetical protein n=1 Tax=Lysobacter gummosus TaxID=262324 RepID=UPI00363E4318